MVRHIIVLCVLAMTALGLWLTTLSTAAWPLVICSGMLVVLTIYDILQTKHAVLRNFPVIGHFRYLLEHIRPEIQQYFIESDTNGRPFSREQRSLAYQRSKQVIDTIPFGTKHQSTAPGFEWIEHSMHPLAPPNEAPRIQIGGPACSQPYAAALLNISAMSFGSLSSAAILALNGGAKDGHFAHNTGEGGLSEYHQSNDGDLVWQIGTGYFGCRTPQGGFDATLFAERAALAQVKMIEIKLSQGAKPGHGGILPAGKLTRQIAEIRGVPMGKDVLSPPAHAAFDTPRAMVHWIQTLRDLSGGKPIGIKFCLGNPRDFFAICKAMQQEKIFPDFITIDGAEGGTGAAPLEFSNHVGWPLYDALHIVHQTLHYCELRDKVRVIASGRILDGFDMIKAFALGADLCNSARGMMFALGCIQALRCNHNNCPTGVATQDPSLSKGLDIGDKRKRVKNFQHNTVHQCLDLLAAAGFSTPAEIDPRSLLRRGEDGNAHSFAELYPSWQGTLPTALQARWQEASADRF